MKEEDKQSLRRLRKLVQDFEKLDRNLWTNLRLGHTNHIFEVIEAKRKVKRFLANRSVVHAGGDLVEKLRMIRDNYGYNIDRLVNLFEKKTGQRFSQEAEDERDWIDALFEMGTADYVDQEFYRRRNEIGSLIANQSLPDAFLQNLNRIKECYALGLLEAAVIFCRSVIEAGVFESLRRKGIIQLGKNATDIRGSGLKDFMEKIKRLVNRRKYEEAWQVIKLANRLLHSKGNKIVLSEPKTLDSIKRTFAFLEEMF